MQMDAEFPFGYARHKKITQGPSMSSLRDECFFPQLSLLEEFHKEMPQATLIMNFRPLQDWTKSMKGWTKQKASMLERFQQCHLPNLPRGVPDDLDDELGVMTAMERFMCSHVLHVRQFVKTVPAMH